MCYFRKLPLIGFSMMKGESAEGKNMFAFFDKAINITQVSTDSLVDDSI